MSSPSTQPIVSPPTMMSPFESTETALTESSTFEPNKWAHWTGADTQKENVWKKKKKSYYATYIFYLPFTVVRIKFTGGKFITIVRSQGWLKNWTQVVWSPCASSVSVSRSHRTPKGQMFCFLFLFAINYHVVFPLDLLKRDLETKWTNHRL